MTKKLLPIMIGAALAGGMTAAAADVTIFGQIDESIVNHDVDAGFVDTSKMPGSWYPDNINSADSDDTNLQSTNSSIGVKGSEDLGNGLKAIFMLDWQYDTNNTKGLTDRDQWVGLAGNFGTVKFGTASTSYKAHGAQIDPLYRTAAQGRAWGQQSFLHGNAGEEGEGRATNSIFYTTPDFNGLQVSAHYTLDSDEGSSCFDSASDCEDNDGYGIGASYSNGGLLVFADYLTNDGSTDVGAVGGPTGGTNGELDAWKVGGKYTLNNFAVYAQYEDISDDFGSGYELDATYMHIAGSYTMGNNMLYLGYGIAEADDLVSSSASTSVIPAGAWNGNSGSEQTAITLAGTHSLSKRTMLYAAYVMVEQDNDSGTDALINAYGGLDTNETSKDPEADVFAIGLRHKF